MDENAMRGTWEKVFEYASMPVHGTMSRKLRKGVRIQINEGKVYEKAVMFIDEKFVRLTETGTPDGDINTYYDIGKIISVRTYSAGEP